MPDRASGRKVCLLTGAGGLLGTEFCRRHAQEYDIVAVHRHARVGVSTQHEWMVDPLRPEPSPAAGVPRVFAVRADLRDPAARDRVVELALARFDRIDLLVNAAVHVHRDRLTGLASGTGMLDNAFAVNATLPIALTATVCRQFWLHRRADNEAWGRNVVNISSMASFGVAAGVGLSGYSASKAALNMLSAHQAVELRPVGVRVNVIAPTSFPQLIPTAAVTDAIVDLDRSDLTATAVQLDERGRREISLLGGSFG